MNNISDKDAMREKFENHVTTKLFYNIDIGVDGAYERQRTRELWFTWQVAYECCLSEFEQVAQCYVNSDGECEEIEYTGSMEQWDDDFTPLFTRKG